MHETDRMISWIEFFNSIRRDSPQAIDITGQSENEKRLTGQEVYTRFYPNLDESTIQEIFSGTRVTYFRDFEENEEPFNESKARDLSKIEQDATLDHVAITLECTEQFFLPSAASRETFNKTHAWHYASAYSGLKAAVSFFDQGQIKKRETNAKELALVLESRVDKAIDEALSSALSRIGNASHNVETRLEQQLNSARDAVINSSKEEIDKYKREAGATLVVKNADKLWRDKAVSHRWIYSITALLFVILVSSAIYVPIYNWTKISEEILKLEPLFAGHVLGAVLILLVPVLGVAWVLRLLSRFTTQNMMLADDAQLRRVMAETYVKLVSNDAIKDPEDRAIILSALFRPLPGSNADDVSPPSITDIIKAK